MAYEKTTEQIEEQIRTRAYYLWEADGRPQGRDWEYWIKAKEELETQAPVSTAPAMAPSARKKSKDSEPAAVTTATSKRRNANRTAVYA